MDAGEFFGQYHSAAHVDMGGFVLFPKYCIQGLNPSFAESSDLWAAAAYTGKGRTGRRTVAGDGLSVGSRASSVLLCDRMPGATEFVAPGDEFYGGIRSVRQIWGKDRRRAGNSPPFVGAAPGGALPLKKDGGVKGQIAHHPVR